MAGHRQFPSVCAGQHTLLVLAIYT